MDVSVDDMAGDFYRIVVDAAFACVSSNSTIPLRHFIAPQTPLWDLIRDFLPVFPNALLRPIPRSFEPEIALKILLTALAIFDELRPNPLCWIEALGLSFSPHVAERVPVQTVFCQFSRWGSFFVVGVFTDTW